MTRCWFARTSGILCGMLLVTTSWAQTAQQSSLAERMAALRRGWSQAPQQQQTQPTPPRNNSHSGGENGKQSTSGSFWSNLLPLGNRDDEQADNSSRNGLRTAQAPRAGSVQAPPQAGNYQLPGLGGSPLPASTPNQNTVTASPGSRATTAPQPTASLPTGGTQATVPQTGAPRQSPNRRTAPQIDPELLRRELAGSFPTTPSETAATSRTAPAVTNQPTEAPNDVARALRLGATGNSSTPNLEPQPAETVDSNNPESASPYGSAGPRIEAASPFGPVSNSRFAPSPANPSSNASVEKPAEDGAKRFGIPESTDPREPDVLVSNKTPIIATDIRGPKQILVGREANYQIELHNQSEVAAEGMVAMVRIPAWAEVVNTSATQGAIQHSGNGGNTGHLEWQLSRLEPRGHESLDIKLIPRASRPLELGVSWTFTPIGSRAVVEVQEPKLQMMVSGPDEVLYSEPQVFRLTLSNPGTGVAENVTIDLMPPGGGDTAVTSHPIGDLAPGASKTVEVELTANEAGKLFVKAAARAEGGLSADASKEIFCRKAELEVDWRGPDSKYAGTPATYFFRVRNPGTAPAENVAVRVTLPPGAEFTSASDGQSFDANEREVEWQIGTLGPGDDSYMELKCVLNTPGVNQLRVAAEATSANLSTTKLAETNIIALADLKLAVSDPSGPVAVGAPAFYEIRVRNRGSSSANDVNVVALFSDGIEPDHVEGAMYTIEDGRVTFRTIDELQAGREIVLKVRARAASEGTHVFRAEVLCRELEIKLAAEETTRFYAEEIQPESRNSNSSAEGFQGFESASK